MHPLHDGSAGEDTLEAAAAVGIHWGVFRLTDERREEPPERLLAALARRGIAASLFPAGEPGLSYEAGRLLQAGGRR